MKSNVKPIFRYIGGKTWLKKKLNEKLEKILIENQKINSYYEPFAGGLGAFFSNLDVLYKYNIKKIHLNDINTCLINVYKMIMSNKDELIRHYSSIENEFLSKIPQKIFQLHKINDKNEIKKILSDCNEFFKNKRTLFNITKNSNDILNSSALFLFLANHSFNGIYRENKKGEYNTAFNWEAKNFNHIIDRINNVNFILNKFDITFSNYSFEEIPLLKDQFIYADPPYINNTTNTENNYHSDKFDIIKMKKLVDHIKNNEFIFSHYYNSDIIDFFHKNIEIEVINKKNKISADSNTRSDIKTEMLICTI